MLNKDVIVCWILLTREVFAVRRGVNFVFEILNFINESIFVFLNDIELFLKPWFDYTLEYTTYLD
jgi:hypothetical protein